MAASVSATLARVPSLRGPGKSARDWTSLHNHVRIIDSVDGGHVMLNASGSLANAGTEILALQFAHRLDVRTLFDNGGIRA
jgi:hypothetical protein